MEPSDFPRVAFLGPVGSFSHECAVNHFGDSVEYVPQNRITDVFASVAADVPFAVIPSENSTYGSVAETYDALRRDEAGTNVFIRGDVLHPVKHCLVVRKGVQLEDVQRVVSHEQALGQCSRYLSETLPHAFRAKTTSTSAAARSILSCGEDPEVPESAAICSLQCAQLVEGLDIVQTDIQDFDNNCTRFYILASSLDAPLPKGVKQPKRHRAVIRFASKAVESAEDQTTPRNRILHLGMSTLLTTFGCPALRIDRRPSLSNVPFEDVYFIEIGELTIPLPDGLHADWAARVQAGIERVHIAGGDAMLLGTW